MAGEPLLESGMPDALPPFPTAYFEDVTGLEETEYLAFLYDADNEPVGTVTAVNLFSIQQHLREHTVKSNYTYVLVQVLETSSGEIIH